MNQSTKRRLERAKWHYEAVRLSSKERRDFVKWFKDSLLAEYHLRPLNVVQSTLPSTGRLRSMFAGFEVQIKNDDDFMLFKLRWSDFVI
jgi:hypothetical protein